MSNKNRKRNLRKIVVNDEEYFWNVSSPNCDGDGGCSFKIWKEGKVFYDDLIHYPIIVTPKVVREIIESI